MLRNCVYVIKTGKLTYITPLITNHDDDHMNIKQYCRAVTCANFIAYAKKKRKYRSSA